MIVGLLKKFRKYCYQYLVCLVKIQVENKDGTIGIGTGFRIGDGYIATARHVVDVPKFEIYAHKFIGSSIRNADFSLRSDDPADHTDHLLTAEQPLFPDDSSIDVAVVKTDFDPSDHLAPTTFSRFKKRGHFKLQIVHDWDVFEADMMLRSVMMIGYPSIPLTNDSFPVCVKADINAIVGKCNTPHAHLILSSTARGGFSGSPVLDSSGKIIAICTESLNRDAKMVETGFTAAILIQPLNELLARNQIFPEPNSDLLQEVNLRNQAYDEYKRLRAEKRASADQLSHEP